MPRKYSSVFKALLPLIVSILTLGLCVACSSGNGGVYGGGGGYIAPAFQNYGPEAIDIGTGSQYYSFTWVNSGFTVDYYFTVAGAPVKYSVVDPDGNTILVGNSGNKAQSGQGSFVSASAGEYKLLFRSSGILTPSVVTVNYTVHYS